MTLKTDLVAALGALPNKTAKAMAHTTYKVLRKHAIMHGQSPNEVVIRKPGEPSYLGTKDFWIVAWEAGPYDWAIGASFDVIGATGKLCEPYYGFDLCFYPNEDN